MKGFKNCNIYVEGKGIVKSNLEVENGKIASFNAVDGALELDDKYIVVPGFIDRHIHGANNSDSMYPTLKDIRNICATVASEGVSTFLPTTMTQTVENICKALENIANYIETENDKGAYVLGMHLEGPFISKKHKGAQVESCIIPCSVEKFQIFEKASHGYIKEVTMAYEENGKELANYLHSKGIVASIGHTDATCAEVIEASKNGVTSATHTYNAMKGLHHREAGTVGGVFLCDSIYSELICDLVHVSSDAIKVLYKIKGQDKITLITDGIEAKHLPDGKYKLGGQDVYVKGKEARLADGTLAGSTLKMNDAIRNMQGVIGLSMEKAIDLATINPARVLGIDNQKGSIALGKDADFAIIDKYYNVYMTVSNGRVVFDKLTK
ncbi:MAG: N-acetylglucosamine-6-phosphate deacetylase [Coprobacillus sp. 28_7]|nr:MAG: N-acetylglucosamine-6-phosphate deacetylase [Coprobacillus sp. 28_7]